MNLSTTLSTFKKVETGSTTHAQLLKNVFDWEHSSAKCNPSSNPKAQ